MTLYGLTHKISFIC